MSPAAGFREQHPLPTIIRVLLCLVAALGLAHAASAQVAAPPAAPASTEAEPYRMGPGDELSIKIHSGANEDKPIELEFPVSGDGTIDVVFAGKLKVAGLTASEAQDRIRRRLIDGGFMQRPFVSVNIAKYLSQCVNVAGAVSKQGRYCLQGPTRLLDILSMAEGVDEENAGRMIVVNRQGATEPIRVDRRALVGGDMSKSQAANIRVLAGDNVYVPVKARVCVSGPLEDAGCFAFDEGATLQEAIAMAKGLKPFIADRSNVVLKRRGGEEIKIDLDKLAASGDPAPLLEPDDQIIVGEISVVRFCVNGQVAKPDCLTDVVGLTIEGALSKAGGLLPNKADGKNVVVRRIVDGRPAEFKINMDDRGASGAGFLIEMDDQVVVPALDCVVSVTGGVRQAQQVEFKTGMTLTDALSAAGGTTNEQGFALGKLTGVILRRGDSVQTIDAKSIMRGRAKDVPLQCGDRILVPTRGIGGGGT